MTNTQQTQQKRKKNLYCEGPGVPQLGRWLTVKCILKAFIAWGAQVIYVTGVQRLTERRKQRSLSSRAVVGGKIRLR